MDTVDILMIGEGPGKGEDALGRPFVGRAGKLLRTALYDAGLWKGNDISSFPYHMLTGGVDVTVGFTNLVCCRPTDRMGGENRPPSEDEVNNCSDRLKRTIELVSPYAIVLLGLVAQEHFHTDKFEYLGPICHMKHPSAIERNGGTTFRYYSEYVGKFRAILNEVDQMKKSWKDQRGE